MVSTSALAQVPIDVLELLGLMSSLMPKLDLSYPLISLMPIHGSPLVLKETYTLHFFISNLGIIGSVRTLIHTR